MQFENSRKARVNFVRVFVKDISHLKSSHWETTFYKVKFFSVANFI